MPTVAVKSKGKKMDAITGDAVDRLLTSTKKKMLREKGRIDYDQLEREGFSAAMIERLKSF